MSRFDVRPASERARADRVETRVDRFLRHHANPAVCECVTKYSIECRCCAQVLCFSCGGIIYWHEDRNGFVTSDFIGPVDDPFHDSLEGI